MSATVFFSWQADTPNKIGRNFLREVLEKVCSNIASDTALEEPLRVDSDTQDVAGQPPIAETIFKKIDKAGVFLADLTFTGKRLDGRPSPNPNVLIEYGWALKSLSYERVISVMNSAYGRPNHNDLPFDLKHLRWPITYELKEDTTPEVKAKEKQELIKKLESAIRASLATIKLPEVPPPPIFPAEKSKDGPARFRTSGKEIGIEEDSFSGVNRHVYLNSGPAMWLRLMPTAPQPKKLVTEEVKKIAIGDQTGSVFPLYYRGGGYSYLQAADGIGVYRAPPNHRSPNNNDEWTPSLAFVFRTGEIWSVDTVLLSFKGGFIPITDFEAYFVDGLQRYSRFLKILGIKGPYQWEAGLVGIKEMRLDYPPPPGRGWAGGSSGPTCKVDEVIQQGLFNEGDNPTTSLLPFFESVFEENGRKRPDYLPQ